MRLWPKTRGKRIVLVILLTILATLILGSAFLFYKINSDVISKIKVLNPQGENKALVIYHPGLSDFQRKVTLAFANGLVSSGWRVEVTTASSRAVADLSSYDLLVLGSPTYGFKPASSIQRYISRVGDFQGKQTVVIVTAAGSAGGSLAIMEKLIQDRNGFIVKSLKLFTQAPNDGNPLDIATQAGKEFLLP